MLISLAYMLDHLSTYAVNMSATGNNINQQQPMAVIKRPQHNLKLSTVLNNMLQCSSLVDVTIYCDDGQVNAHKLVLAASSSYFRSLFSRMTNTFQYPIIVLREMPVDDLKTIIQFIYHGEINVPQNRVDSLMRCANYLQIDGMASSANSINAILASSSSMSHALLTPASAISNPINANTANSFNKVLPQYPPTNSIGTKQSRGHSSRSNNASNNNNTSTSNHSNFINGSNTNNSNNNTNNSGKPRHTCNICLKTFTHGFTLKRHMKLHSQSRNTIYCDVCSKSYSCKDSFLRHKKSSGHLQHAEFHHRSNINIGSEA